MKESVKTVYKCEYCGKNLLVKHAAIKHEKWCTKNPDNWPKCDGCIFISEVKIEIPDVWSDGDTRLVNGFKCKKLQKNMYPKKAEKKGLIEKYPETFADQIPMPKECEHFDNRLV